MFKLFKFLIITLTLFQFGNNSNAQTVGDVMPYYDASTSKFYVYYLRDIWNDATGQRHPWNAFTTTDCASYTEIGEKLSCSTDACKQDFAIGTGSVIKEGTTYYAFYTGHNPNTAVGCVTTKEGIMLATSTGANTAFTKSTSFATIYAPSGYDLADNFRDPYVFKDGTTYYMLVSARTSVNGTWKGVVAKYTSTNLTSWTYAGILYDGGSDNFFMMECAQIFKMGSTYYLIYSYTDSKNVYYRKSTSVNGPWSKPSGTDILGGVGYSARTASNGINTYIWGWQVNGTTWAGKLLNNQLIQNANGDLTVISIANIPVTGVSLSPTTAAINTGATHQLTATVLPSNATNKTVSWNSSNTSIATVNSSGLVTGVAAGTATITVATQDGNKIAICAVTVNNTTVPVSGVSVSLTTTTINVGATQQLTPSVIPSNATNKTVSWNSSNNAIATVNSSGLVIGVGQGTATITVTTQDGNKTATCAVTVNNITVPVTGVSVSPTSTTINVGATQQLTTTVAPLNATNKTVTWNSSNTSIATVNKSGLVTGVAAGTATITVVTQDGGKTATCTVTVSTPTGIVAGTYEIIARNSGKAMDADQGGSVNGAAVQQWDYLGGGNQKWNVVPTSPTGYYTITSVNGGKVIDSDGSANGSKIQVWSSLGGDNQKWQIVDLGNGYFKILSKIVSVRGIEVAGSSLTNGAQLKLADYTGGTQQQWNFVLLALKSATSIEAVADASSKLIVYPVPAKDIFTIDLTPFNEDKDVNIVITDLFGKMITNVKATDLKYTISSKNLGMNSGMYFIIVKSENRTSVVKMIIE